MKILLVDNHPLMRKGLISALSLENKTEQVKGVSTVREAMHELVRFNPDITIIEIGLRKEDGLEIVRKARSQDLKSRFIIIASTTKKEDFTNALKVNVDGYILKHTPEDDVIHAFEAVIKGRKYYASEILEKQFSAPVNSHLDCLTVRERDVFKELRKGASNAKIAQSLYISENTVKKHISSILSKLNLRQRTEAAVSASKLFNSAD